MQPIHPGGKLEREVWLGKQAGLREIEMFGWTSVPSADQLTLGRHSHPGAYEICLIVGGHVTWWADGQAYALGPGQVYITRPDEPHGGSDDVLQPCSLYWLIIRLRGNDPLPGLSRAMMRRLTRGFTTMRHRSFPASDELARTFAQLHEALRDPGDLAPLLARSLLHTLLVRVVHDHARADVAGEAIGNPTPPIRRAMTYIEDHLAEMFHVEHLAGEVGLGVSRFHERFVAEVGFSPAAYRMHLRIHRARQQLRQSDQPITELAHDLGFSSSQHFATAFRRAVGLTPTAFRRRYASSPSSSN